MYLYHSCGPLNSRITWPPYLQSESGNLAYYLAILENFLYSYEFAYYLATLLKVRVRKSRALLGHFIKILILLRIRALLGHSFQDRLHKTRA